MNKDELYEVLIVICDEIEAGCAKIAGIGPVMSDYWLCTLEDWAQEPGNKEEMEDWIQEKYGIQNDGHFNAVSNNPIMEIALFIHLYRTDV